METTLNKKVVITGGTGLVGKRLCARLESLGYSVTIISRQSKTKTGIMVAPWSALTQELKGAYGVINLAGEGIADKRWSEKRKQAILSSRVDATRTVVDAINSLGTDAPKVFATASAIGIYGFHDGAPIDEKTEPGQGFLAEVCQAWENEADKLQNSQTRISKIRIGIVLAPEGGALPKMSLPIKLFQGSKLGHGQQGFSWIHIEDLVSIFIQCLEDERYSGILNATSPFPTTNQTFTNILGKQLRRPILPVPGFVTRLALGVLLGEMADEMLLKGSFVYPKKLSQLGFKFQYDRAELALKDLLG